MYNKQNLVDAVHAENGGSRASAERIVDTVLVAVKEQVKEGNKVSLAGFGIFTSKKVKGRVGRNPRTGESVKVAPRTKVKFTPLWASRSSLIPSSMQDHSHEVEEKAVDDADAKPRNVVLETIGVLAIMLTGMFVLIGGSAFLASLFEGENDPPYCYYEVRTAYESEATNDPIIKRVFVNCP